jgi:hypothetical protein
MASHLGHLRGAGAVNLVEADSWLTEVRARAAR